MIRVQTVTVIGATGTMGMNIVELFASLGEARVFCVGREIEKVKYTILRIVKSSKADVMIENLIPADFSMLEDCIRQSDVVFESCKEDLSIKKEVARKVGRALQPHAVSGTGTSGLSVSEIASCYPESLRGNFFGIHLFNPPHTLRLCELTPTVYSDGRLQTELKEYLKTKLHRTVVEVKDSPAFLGNRIGFQFINEALQYAERYKDKGGIDYIDAILGPYTGRAMAPLATSDFVGLDVHKAIVDNIYNNTHDYASGTFTLPMFAQKLIAEGKLGRKSGGGLYRLVKDENGKRQQSVYDVSTGLYRDVIPYAFPFADRMKKQISEGNYAKAFESLICDSSKEAEICLEFLLKYIIYSLYAAEEVGFYKAAADDVMAAGFNWCPPLAMYEALSTAADVPQLIHERIPEICRKTDVDRLLFDVIPSQYDYRQYFKSEHKRGGADPEN